MSLPLATLPRRTRQKSLAALFGIGTAAPAPMPQEQILQMAIGASGAALDQQAWLTRLFRGCGIQTRGIVVANTPINGNIPTPDQQLKSACTFYPPSTGPTDHGPTTETRMSRYAADAPPLAITAVRASLSQSQIAPEQITHLFTASCTGFMAPGIDCALIEQLHLSPQVRRLHIGFMGCHAAFNLLAVARDVVRTDPRARVLVCCVELCSLHLAYGLDPGKLVANALFADGAAAAVLGASSDGDGHALHLTDTASMLIPNSADAMTWRIGNHGFEMTLSPGIPNLIREHLRPWCEKFLARHRLKITDIAGWAIHPGGPKILDAVGETLHLSAESLEPSRQILARHGNMSSVTVLFILQKMLPQRYDGPSVAIGLGPGLMAEGMLFNAPQNGGKASMIQGR
jgi:predicted naringenin-chalcone synthase